MSVLLYDLSCFALSCACAVLVWVFGKFFINLGRVRFPGEVGELATFSRGSLP